MKKLLALLLVLAMLLALAACGGDKAGTGDAQTAGGDTEGAAESDLTLGVYDEQTHTYTNDFFGIGCQLDETWENYDADQIAELNSTTQSLVTDEELSETLSENGSSMIFYAGTSDGLRSANLCVQDLGVLYGTLLDEQAFAEQGSKSLQTGLESMGCTDVTVSTTSMQFAGAEHAAITVHGKLQDVDLYETQICIKMDKYIGVLTVGSYVEDSTSDILDLFYAL